LQAFIRTDATRTVRRLLSAAALALVLQPSQAQSQRQPRLEFRELYSEGAVQVLYDGRMIRSYGGATGDLIREFRSADPRRGSLFLLAIRTGGNACMPEMAVMDAGRTPPHASDVFGDCNPAILVGNRDHLALSVRSDGGRPDDVWYYDGRSVKQ
jgi:hypothetical protein